MSKKLNFVLKQHHDTLQMLAVMAVMLFLPDICNAASTGADGAYRSAAGEMPWSTALDNITKEITGPIPRFIGVFAVAGTGAMLAFGEMGHAMRKMLQIVFGISIALSATLFVGWMGGKSSGLLF